MCSVDFHSRARLIKHLAERRVRAKARTTTCQQAFMESCPPGSPRSCWSWSLEMLRYIKLLGGMVIQTLLQAGLAKGSAQAWLRGARQGQEQWLEWAQSRLGKPAGRNDSHANCDGIGAHPTGGARTCGRLEGAWHSGGRGERRETTARLNTSACAGRQHWTCDVVTARQRTQVTLAGRSAAQWQAEGRGQSATELAPVRLLCPGELQDGKCENCVATWKAHLRRQVLETR